MKDSRDTFVVEDANVDAKTFTLIDPAGDARTKGRKIVTWSCFDDARRAFGTDEDLLFVSLRAKDFDVDDAETVRVDLYLYCT